MIPSIPPPRLDLTDANLDEILSEISMDDLDTASLAGSSRGNEKRSAFLQRIQTKKGGRSPTPNILKLDL
jgi:hypothetical protein